MCDGAHTMYTCVVHVKHAQPCCTFTLFAFYCRWEVQPPLTQSYCSSGASFLWWVHACGFKSFSSHQALYTHTSTHTYTHILVEVMWKLDVLKNHTCVNSSLLLDCVALCGVVWYGLSMGRASRLCSVRMCAVFTLTPCSAAMVLGMLWG